MRRSFLFTLLLIMTGCTVRAPSATQLRPDEVASVSFSRSDPSIEVSSAVLDGQSVSTDFQTIEIGAGHHTVALTYRVRVSEICDDLRAQCPTTSVTGRCEGEFSVVPGQKVVVDLSARRGDLEARVRPPVRFGSWFEDPNPDIARLVCEQLSSVDGFRRGAQ